MLLLAIAVISFLGATGLHAVLLMMAAKLVGKLNVRLGRAFVPILLSNVTNLLLCFGTIAIAMATFSKDTFLALRFALVPIDILIQSGFISWCLELSYWRACLVSLVMIVIGIAISVFLLLSTLMFLAIFRLIG